jgi:predicted kinase
MSSFSEFLEEANRKSQRASKSGRKPKEGPRSKGDDKPSAVVTVGLPGSGKSTIAKHMVSKGKTDQHELDKSRQALGRGPAHFGQDIVQHTYGGAEKSAKQGRSTILSNTSIPKQHRQDAISKLKDAGYENVTAVLSPGSTKAAMRRNRKRTGSKPGEGAVPQFVMNRMAQGMQQMSRDERRELRSNYKELHKKERFTKPAMKRSGAIREAKISAKTFEEFIAIAEKYYAPDDKLPSGDTPVGKALKKKIKRNSNIGPDSNINRMNRHADKIETKVKHGADNPNYNRKKSDNDRDITIDSDSNNYMTIHHKPSKITYNVTNMDDGIHSIEWQHGKGERKNLSRSERMRIASDAKKVWNQHVAHRLPYGDVAHNQPSISRDEKTKQEKPVNRRANIYQRSGFGPTDASNDQFARIGREPSPKQKAKKKTRLKPLDPQQFKKEAGWLDN